MRPLLAALAVAALAAGCKDRSPAASEHASAPTTAAPHPTAKPAAPHPTARARPAARITRAEVQALIDRWLAAQNHGDFAAYGALYADDFHGVRRSGTQTVALDRSGWLADRGRMFKAAMTVSARDLAIALGPNQAEVHLTQDFVSGRYHDLGPKRLRLTRRGDGLAIAAEEMLASRLIVPLASLPLVSPAFALLYRGEVLLADQPDLAVAVGAATLEHGEVTTQDPTCADDPGDYEHDQDRYWACHNSDPRNAHDHFEARQGATWPDDLASLRGARLALYDATGRRCDATVGATSLWAEADVTMASIDVKDPAASVLALGHPVLLGRLDGGCAAAFARAADLPAPPMWPPATPSAAERAAALAALSQLDGYAGLGDVDGPPGPADVTLYRAAASSYLVATIAGHRSCSEDGFVGGVWRVGRGGALDLQFSDSDRPFAITAAAELTGDGVPELVTTDGFLTSGPTGYQRYVALDFPDEVAPSYCGD